MLHSDVEHAKTIDREWFDKHPQRTIRIRDALPFEFNQQLPSPRSGFSWRTIVKKLGPERRSRIPLATRSELQNEEATEEDLKRILSEVAPDALKHAFNA